MKYQGSKNRIGNDIFNVIIKDERVKRCSKWIEPFVGGANMIDKVSGFKRIGYDCNKYVIEMFKEIQNGWMPPDNITNDEYADIKNNMNNYPDYLVGFVGIGCSFAGKWFGGYARGGVRNYCAESKRNILKQKNKIQDVNFNYISSYKLIYDLNCYQVAKDEIVYCDPPYLGTTKYKDKFNHKEFWEWCNKLVDIGKVVYVSEYVAPDDWMCVWQKEIISNLDLNTGNKKAVEKLFTKKI